MSLYSKELKNALKEEIKEKARGQRSLKEQRKTVNLIGERTLDPFHATLLHKINREELRDLYLVYGVVREKDLQTIDKNVWKFYSQEGINSLVLKKLESYEKTLYINS